MAIRARLSWAFENMVDPIGRLMAKAGVTPNWITFSGLVLTAIAGWQVVADNLVLVGWILVIGGMADTFDGSVARARGSSSAFGGFYDSTADRVSDGIVLGVLAWYVRDEPLLFAVAITALVAASSTSYIRAKAESLGATCSVGFMERAERSILTMIALVFSRWVLVPVLWILAVGGVITVVHRLLHVMPQLEGIPAGAKLVLERVRRPEWAGKAGKS